MAKVKTWGVNDFKSLAGVRLTLPPLTILSGANSSGKSSILQSLLLLGQTVNRGGSVVLNGPLVRLGLPKDVVRSGQKTIQFRLNVQVESDKRTKAASSEVQAVFSLMPNKTNTALVLSAFEIIDTSNNIAILSATAERLNSADITAIGALSKASATFLRVTIISGRKAPSRMYLSCLGLLPLSLIVHRDHKTIEKQILSYFLPVTDGDRLSYDLLQEISRLIDKVDFLQEVPKDISADEEIKEKEALSQALSGQFSVRDLRKLSPANLELLIRKIAHERSQNEWIVASPSRYGFFSLRLNGFGMRSEGIIEDMVANEYETPLTCLLSVAEAVQEFGTSLRYLGPLRDEPKVVHGVWDQRVDSLPVGIRGELTAEVLTRRKLDQITYWDWTNRQQRKLLPQAVADWCNYLGIGDRINVLDLGKQGRAIELRVNGVHRDLTTIGVGASQLLPVLVAGLTVPDGSVVMVEQPELHLHPLVQSRLADFFLYARPRVKFIVETHSEYLITRIRRRVAEDKFDPTSVQVLFAEQRTGATTVRSLGLSEFGDFEAWPDGFFDAQDNDSLKIMRAVSQRLDTDKP